MATADVNRVEAPLTMKAYLMCAFASVGGLFFGYDSGYISGVMGMKYFIHLYVSLRSPLISSLFAGNAPMVESCQALEWRILLLP